MPLQRIVFGFGLGKIATQPKRGCTKRQRDVRPQLMAGLDLLSVHHRDRIRQRRDVHLTILEVQHRVMRSDAFFRKAEIAAQSAPHDEAASYLHAGPPIEADQRPVHQIPHIEVRPDRIGLNRRQQH